MTVVPIRFTGKDVYRPKKSYVGDAGFDLVCSEDTIVPLNGFADVPLGISIELPTGVWAMITGRSSTIRRRRLLVTQGIIDNGYRGELFAGVQNLGDGSTTVRSGERIAQLIPFDLTAARLDFVRVSELGTSDRDVSGFGSTGA